MDKKLNGVELVCIGVGALVVANIAANVAFNTIKMTTKEINKIAYKSKIKKGLKKGTIVEIDGEYYDVAYNINNDENK